MTDLFSPMDLHGIFLPNRIWMSAMTRTRATPDNVPTPLMGEYFAQRAAAGLIVTDCTAVSEQGRGVINGPGIWREDQIEGWRIVTDAVHAAGGRIYCQLWHCGRVAHPDMREGALPVAPSPLPADGKFKFPDREVDFPIPRELAADEIPAIIADFARGTRNARDAGFDGVELHAANGYLHDQFLQDVSNKRTDDWGGSIENRARLILYTVDAMADAWAIERVGVRLAPSISLYGMGDSDPLSTFGHVVRELDERRIGCLTMLEPNAKDRENGVAIAAVAKTFRPMTSVPFIVNTGFDKAKGMAAIKTGDADAVAYGVSFLANPDLVERFEVDDEKFNKPDPSTFYGVGAEGYTDYPTMATGAAR
ncbi:MULTISPECIES: alkene reductase [Sphingobium]|uniref:Alkene reductase n=3 Tax=Sphingobium TaxID=165695 RepID=A0A5B8CBM9_SPHSA|nr:MULTISPECIES: alkene reductase [Sphingobium]QDC36613.1 alkene reductase [Sphingobium fuliginis ATCC 27551]QNG43902.1 alkene reductase [Sphingobium yanoikuyae]